MRKTHRIVLIAVALVLFISGSVAGFYLFYVVPRKEVVAEPMERVIIPEYFARYAEEIQLADKKATDHANLMRDGSPVTLLDLHGFFDLPLKQKVFYQQIRAPGDPREYRKGIHQGIDFYETKRGDPIYAAAPGVIIRIDKEHQPMNKEFRDEMLRICLQTWNGTPGSVRLPPVEEPYGDVLDKLRGRQVILYHGKNAQNEPIISLYAHMLDVNQELSAYDIVNTDTIIGYIGNSGTSGEVENNTKKENHLHMELFVGGMYWTPKKESEIGIKQSNLRYAELQKLVFQELSREYASAGEQPESFSAETTSQP